MFLNHVKALLLGLGIMTLLAAPGFITGILTQDAYAGLFIGIFFWFILYLAYNMGASVLENRR